MLTNRIGQALPIKRQVAGVILMNSCTSHHLILAYLVGQINQQLNRGASINELMKLTQSCNSVVNGRLRYLCGEKEKGLWNAIMYRRKSGPRGSYLHFLREGVLLKDLETVMHDTNIDYRRYQIGPHQNRQSADLTRKELPKHVLKKNASVSDVIDCVNEAVGIVVKDYRQKLDQHEIRIAQLEGCFSFIQSSQPDSNKPLTTT